MKEVKDKFSGLIKDRLEDLKAECVFRFDF